PRHGRGDHGRLRDFPHARAGRGAARPPLAHVHRLGPGRRARAARSPVLRRARHAVSAGGRQVCVRARSVRDARGLRRGLGRGGGVVLAFAAGSGVAWRSTLPTAPTGAAVLVALAVAFQAVIWTYYGYLDVAKIAEEVVDPSRTLPRILLGGIGAASALYLLLN